MLTLEEREHFDTQGFLTMPGALPPEHLARVQSAAQGAEARWRSDTSLLGGRSNVLEQIQAPIEYHRELRDLLWYPPVFNRVRDLIGGDVQMIDNDYFITPPRTPRTHAGWHNDVGMPGIEHANSLLMVKVFYLLSDVDESSGGTAMIPGSHKFPNDHVYPNVEDPKAMPGAIQMTGRAGDAYLFNGRIYHCAVNNDSDNPRRVLIYNYGHFWMKMWSGYEPSPALIDEARASGDPVQMQLLGIGDAYGQRLPPLSTTNLEEG